MFDTLEQDVLNHRVAMYILATYGKYDIEEWQKLCVIFTFSQLTHLRKTIDNEYKVKEYYKKLERAVEYAVKLR